MQARLFSKQQFLVLDHTISVCVTSDWSTSYCSALNSCTLYFQRLSSKAIDGKMDSRCYDWPSFLIKKNMLRRTTFYYHKTVGCAYEPKAEHSNAKYQLQVVNRYFLSLKL